MPEISPEMLARIDQHYESAKAGLAEMVDEARGVLAEHGPAKAAALLSVHHIDCAGHDPHVLGGALGLALVELARQEAVEIHAREVP